jgi:hypothetical protein
VNLARVTWWTGHSAPFLATAAAALGLGGIIWERLNHPVILGATGAVSGLVWWADYSLRNRLAREEAARQAKFERTPPDLEFVGARLQGGSLIVAVKSINRVPFSCRWVCVTIANQIVGGILTQDEQVFPDALPERAFVFAYQLQLSRIRERYLELRFRYESAYPPKLGNPEDLRQRTLAVAWEMNDGNLVRTEVREPPGV